VLRSVADILQADPRIPYAVVFGSWARGTQHSGSDLDVAIGGDPNGWSALELGSLIGRLEGAAGCPVDLVLLDAAALAARKARAALDYFDWQPVEALFHRPRPRSA
jgi:predicted nucleotidyltransferase